MLGILLLFEGAALIMLMRDQAGDAGNFFIAVIVGLIACGIPYGYAIALVIGTLLYYIRRGTTEAR
jgi:adenine/guanine phosphoribosyltransferase-like PRPP-binding protein